MQFTVELARVVTLLDFFLSTDLKLGFVTGVRLFQHVCKLSTFHSDPGFCSQHCRKVIVVRVLLKRNFVPSLERSRQTRTRLLLGGFIMIATILTFNKTINLVVVVVIGIV